MKSTFDSSSFSSLYRRTSPVVFRRACSILQSEADAHEVVQDLYLSLFESPEQYKNKSSIMTFLYSATTHACLNRLRNQRNRERLTQERGAELAAQYESPQLSADQRLLLQTALQKMPEELAQVAVYRFLDGLSHEEVATVMNCSRRHVGNLLQRTQSWAKEHAADFPCPASVNPSC